jgi:hypothetical protein
MTSVTVMLFSEHTDFTVALKDDFSVSVREVFPDSDTVMPWVTLNEVFVTVPAVGDRVGA